jgi:hypothetical protein
MSALIGIGVKTSAGGDVSLNGRTMGSAPYILLRPGPCQALDVAAQIASLKHSGLRHHNWTRWAVSEVTGLLNRMAGTVLTMPRKLGGYPTIRSNSHLTRLSSGCGRIEISYSIAIALKTSSNDFNVTEDPGSHFRHASYTR